MGKLTDLWKRIEAEARVRHELAKPRSAHLLPPPKLPTAPTEAHGVAYARFRDSIAARENADAQYGIQEIPKPIELGINPNSVADQLNRRRNPFKA